MPSRELNYAPSWAEVQRHYQAACRLFPRTGCMGGEYDRLSKEHSWRRKVSAEFHRRLKRAGIYVDGVS